VQTVADKNETHFAYQLRFSRQLKMSKRTTVVTLGLCFLTCQLLAKLSFLGMHLILSDII
jgi:hypothetical protein